MNKFFYRMAGALLVASTCTAFAVGNVYLRGDIGAVQSDKISNAQNFYQESRKTRFKNGFASSIGIGYRINKNLRTELAYSRIDNLKYSKSNVLINSYPASYKQKLKLQASMVNLYYDIPLQCRRLIPYLGIGFGYSNINLGKATKSVKTEYTRTYNSKNANNFSYSLMLGTTVNRNKKFDIDIGYKFQDFGKAKGFNSVLFNENIAISNKNRVLRNKATISLSPVMSGPKIRTHSIMIGVRYGF